MRLTIGVWPSRWSFDRFFAKYQYQGTDMWEQSFPHLNKFIDLKSFTDIETNYTGATIAPVDLDVDMPITVHAIISGDKISIPGSQEERLKAYTLSRLEREAGCCPLCRISGVSHVNGQYVKIGTMFVMAREGQVITKRVYGDVEREVPGVWMPCLCSPEKAKEDTV